MGFKHILLDPVDAGIMCLTINRPKVLNALNKATLEEINQAIDQLEVDNNTRLLLITGAGEKAFVAGADIEEMSQLSALEAKAFSAFGLSVLRRLENASFPVIGLVNGFALGGGCELAMSCDLILASDNAKFGQPEINLGITPGFGGSQRLTRLVGRPMALELLYTGRIFGVEEALGFGLINYVYPQAQLMEKGLEMSREIVSKSRSSIQLIKQLVQRGQDLPLDNACIMESDQFGLSFSSPDQAEGMAAFLEKRAPHFN
ncbi:Enoyl-CoA hydratase/carnithine racemase [Marinomonas sp. MED121]|uniref:enoyl-CoA hydratase-related protein n=1 Tax=Marinomonas sp. MED121 TaxID=314277 RepID=UPI0000691117|nr:enoyl-CoA hydratase-related protein [Marinomonas sp. MED121]EAQ67725.1 Enoyl-CoA hydratase/carnithine racemase [Marinomonas sp. MED121]